MKHVKRSLESRLQCEKGGRGNRGSLSHDWPLSRDPQLVKGDEGVDGRDEKEGSLVAGCFLPQTSGCPDQVCLSLRQSR